MENGAQREEVEENRTNNSEREMKVEIKKNDKENEDSKCSNEEFKEDYPWYKEQE